MEAALPSRNSFAGGRMRRVRHSAAGFTLSEVMISASLSVLLVGSMLAAFFHLTKSGLAMGNFHDLEGETRQVLQYFARDVHQAEDAAWIDKNTLRLSLEGTPITYLYNPNEGLFIRRVPGETDRVLASGINNFHFTPFDLSGTEISLASQPANAGPRTKMILVKIELSRQAGLSTNTASIVSSRYMLRNKKVL